MRPVRSPPLSHATVGRLPHRQRLSAWPWLRPAPPEAHNSATSRKPADHRGGAALRSHHACTLGKGPDGRLTQRTGWPLQPIAHTATLTGSTHIANAFATGGCHAPRQPLQCPALSRTPRVPGWRERRHSMVPPPFNGELPAAAPARPQLTKRATPPAAAHSEPPAETGESLTRAPDQADRGGYPTRRHDPQQPLLTNAGDDPGRNTGTPMEHQDRSFAPAEKREIAATATQRFTDQMNTARAVPAASARTQRVRRG